LPFPLVGKIGIFSNKRAQGCPHSIRSFKAGEETGEMQELLIFFFAATGIINLSAIMVV
jgi:hypothetical protein